MLKVARYMDDKALQMGKTSTAGSFFLLIGSVVASVVMALGNLFLNDFLTVDLLGVLSTVVMPATVIGFFRDLGVNSAITQRIASLRAANKSNEIHDVVFSGVIFQLTSGLLFSLVCFALSGPLAMLINKPELSPLIALMSVSIFANSIVSVATAVFVGFEKMKFDSFTRVLQALIRAVLCPLLVLLGYSVLGAVLGLIVASSVCGVAGILLVYFAIFRPLRKSRVGKCNIKQTLIPLFKYGIPLTPSGIVTGVLPIVFMYIVARYVSFEMMGNYNNAMYYAVLISFISFPISTVLFPAFSKLNPEKELELLKTVFSSSVKYTAIFLIPTTMLIMTLATPLVHTLFPAGGIFAAVSTFPEGSMLPAIFSVIAEPKFLYSPLFLAVSSIANLFVLFGSVSLSAFQIGIGKTKQIMKQSILSIAISVPFFFAITACFIAFGGEMSMELIVIGGLISIMVSTIPGMVWGLIWAWKNYGVKADFKNSGKIFAAALIAAIAAYVFTTLVTAPYAILLAVGAIIYMLVYLTTAPLIGAVNRVDIDNLKMMTSNLGPVSKIIAIPLMFMQKICKKQ
jgi:O-antigen/teichoic acid export membrane protein